MLLLPPLRFRTPIPNINIYIVLIIIITIIIVITSNNIILSSGIRFSIITSNVITNPDILIAINIVIITVTIITITNYYYYYYARTRACDHTAVNSC